MHSKLIKLRGDQTRIFLTTIMNKLHVISLSVSQARGIDDRSKLPYFPYRDDGEVIYQAMEDLVNDYVNL